MKHIFFVTLLCLVAGTLSAQDVYNSSGQVKPRKHKEPTGFDPSRLVFGGGITAQFSTGYIAAGLSPIAGYKFTKHLSAGVGLGYLYQRQSNYFIDPNTGLNKNYPVQAHIVFPGVWARHDIWKSLYGVANFEYAMTNLRTYGYDPAGTGNIVQLKRNFYAPCMFLGAGLKQPLSPNASFILEATYDVIQSPNSPYPAGIPFFRFGFVVGI